MLSKRQQAFQASLSNYRIIMEQGELSHNEALDLLAQNVTRKTHQGFSKERRILSRLVDVSGSVPRKLRDPPPAEHVEQIGV